MKITLKCWNWRKVFESEIDFSEIEILKMVCTLQILIHIVKLSSLQSLTHFQCHQQSMSVPPSHAPTHQLWAQYYLYHCDQWKTATSGVRVIAQSGKEKSTKFPQTRTPLPCRRSEEHINCLSAISLSLPKEDVTMGTCQLPVSVTPGNKSWRNQTFSKTGSLWAKQKNPVCYRCQRTWPGGWRRGFCSLGHTISLPWGIQFQDYRSEMIMNFNANSPIL